MNKSRHKWRYRRTLCILPNCPNRNTDHSNVAEKNFICSLYSSTVYWLLPVQYSTLFLHLPHIRQIPKTSRYYYSFIPFALNNVCCLVHRRIVNIVVLSLVIVSYSLCFVSLLPVFVFEFVLLFLSLQSSTRAAILFNNKICM